MERVKCTISYDGTNFSGYQVQPNGRTVQREVEAALAKIHKGTAVRVVASGRTDAGVHAKGQVLHFDTNLQIPAENWKRALNALLPQDVRTRQAEKVQSTFHSRYDAAEKEYRYFVLNQADADVFRRHYSWHIDSPLSLPAIQEACRHLIGEYDFTSFCATGTDLKGEKIRTIYDASCYQEEEMLIFRFRGSGFLYNMVRILTGTMVEVGRGKRAAADIPAVIQAKDRTRAGETAPPQGLFLWQVTYPPASGSYQ